MNDDYWDDDERCGQMRYFAGSSSLEQFMPCLCYAVVVSNVGSLSKSSQASRKRGRVPEEKEETNSSSSSSTRSDLSSSVT
jgi:hypothetical protein